MAFFGIYLNDIVKFSGKNHAKKKHTMPSELMRVPSTLRQAVTPAARLNLLQICCASEGKTIFI